MTSGGFFRFVDQSEPSCTKKIEESYSELLNQLKNFTHEDIASIPTAVQVSPLFWKQAILGRPKDVIELLPEPLKGDVVFWQTLLHESPDLLEYCPLFLRQNHTLVSYALESDPTVIRFADKKAIIEILHMDSSYNQYLPDTCKDDNDIIMASVRRKGLNLQFASDRLKQNPEIVRQAILSNGLSLQYAHKNLRISEEFVMLAARQNPQALAFMHSELKHKQEFILRLLKSTTLALKYATSLQDNEEFVSKAVSINGLCLEFVSERLKNHDDIVKAAILQNARALRFASNRLKDNEHIVMEAVSKNGLSLAFASKRLKAFETIVYKAVNQNGMALQYADTELKKIKEIVIPACRKDGRALVYAHPQLKKIRAVVLSAVNQNGLALKHAFKDLKKYKEIIMMALSQNGGAIRYASLEFTNVDFYVEFAVLSNPRALNHVHARFLSNKDVMKKVLKRDPFLFDKMDPLLKINEDFLLEVMQENHLIFERIDPRIKQNLEFLHKIPALAFLDEELRTKVFDIKCEDLKLYFISKLIEASNFGKLEDSSLNKQMYFHAFDSKSQLSLVKLLHQLVIRTWTPSLVHDFTLDIIHKIKKLQNEIDAKLGMFESKEMEEVFINFIFKVDKFSSSRLKKLDIYSSCFDSCTENLLEVLTLVPVVWHLYGYDKLVNIGPGQIGAIKELLFNQILQSGLVNVEKLNAVINGLNKARLAHAFVTYLNAFVFDASMKKALTTFIDVVSLSTNLAEIKRFSSSENFLTQEQKKLWHNYNFDSIEGEPVDLISYFKEFLFKACQDEDDDSITSYDINLDVFKTFLLDPTSPPKFLQVGSVEALLCELVSPLSANKIQLIDQLLAKLKKDGYVLVLYHRLLFLRNKLSFSSYVSFSESWEDLFLCGTEVGGSSQRVDGEPQFNRCLLTYLFNPAIKIICVKQNKTSAIKARAILKIMNDSSALNTKRCLLLERFYPRNITKENEALILIKAKQIAKEMNLDLYMFKQDRKKDILFAACASSLQKQEMKKIVSLGITNPCPYEYSDMGYGVTNGHYFVNAVKVNQDTSEVKPSN